MDTKQPRALALANVLRGIDAQSRFANEKLSAASEALESLHAENLTLRAELVNEAKRTADEKLRADQMTQQHRMQADLNTSARAELATLRSGYAAARLEIASLQAQLEAVCIVLRSKPIQPPRDALLVTLDSAVAAIPAGWAGSWRWMRHPDWNDGEPLPVQTWMEASTGVVYYRPFDVDATEFEWAERDAKWEEIPLAPQPAAQAVIDRWDTPLWKDAPATAEYISRLRAALAAPAQPVGDVTAYLTEYAMCIAHERELQATGHKHDSDGALRRYQSAVTRAIASVQPAQVLDAWWPIDTAPKDGDAVILTEGGKVFHGGFITVDFKEIRDGDGNYIDQIDPDEYWINFDDGDVCTPTHWMPKRSLPAPPTAVINGMLEQDTDEVSLDCTIPIGGKPVLVTFDLVLTGAHPVEATEQETTP